MGIGVHVLFIAWGYLSASTIPPFCFFFSSCPQVSVQYQVHLLFIDLCSALRLRSRSLLHAEKTSFITEILGPLGWNETAG